MVMALPWPCLGLLHFSYMLILRPLGYWLLYTQLVWIWSINDPWKVPGWSLVGCLLVILWSKFYRKTPLQWFTFITREGPRVRNSICGSFSGIFWLTVECLGHQSLDQGSWSLWPIDVLHFCHNCGSPHVVPLSSKLIGKSTVLWQDPGTHGRLQWIFWRLFGTGTKIYAFPFFKLLYSSLPQLLHLDGPLHFFKSLGVSSLQVFD